MSRTATATPGSTNIRPTASCLMSWGEPGSDPGQFNLVHNICADADGWVYVADRENHRVQVFDGNGKYETQWNNLHRPCGLYMTVHASPGLLYRRAFGQPPQRQSRAAGQHRRQPGQAVVAHRRPVCRDGADLVYRAARPRRRFARRPLCRRGVLDLVAGALPGPAAPGQSARLAEIRADALAVSACGTRSDVTPRVPGTAFSKMAGSSPAMTSGVVGNEGRITWRSSSGRATTSTASSRTGRNCPTAGRSRRSARSGSTPRTMSMCSTAASTR